MLYFSDPRCNFERGKMQLQTEFPFYEPGNIVNGKIFIELMQPLQASHIKIKVKGKEEAKFKRFWNEVERHDDGTTTLHEREEKVHNDKKFLHFEDNVFAVPGGILNAGTSEISFQFQLPLGIPSSFFFKNKHIREKPKAKVKYIVEAKLCTGSLLKKDMKYKQVLIIREPPVAFKTGERQ